jgi:hypothetical protein
MEQGPGTSGLPALPGACTDGKAPVGRLVHLTREEYDRTVKDLLGDDSRPAAAFPADLERDGFAVGVGIAPLLLQGYLDAAEKLAERARARLSELAPCAGPEAPCATAFIERFGLRAYRRPLEADERARLEEVYKVGAAAGGHAFGMGAIMQAALSSPKFFYRAEIDPAGARAGATVALAPYEVASRLSYFLWKSMPDEALFEAARQGQLATAGHVAAQARRMLADPRARGSVRLLLEQWLELEGVGRMDKDRKLFPFFSSQAAVALGASLEAFTDSVLLDGDGKLETLLQSPVAFINAKVAPFFGVTASGDTFEARTLPAAERPGLLAHPALLGLTSKPNQTDPVHRGKLVRERLLCEPLPPPPPNVDTTIPDPKPGESTRTRFTRHTTDPACGGCHRLIDPIGFGFEAYDAVGRLRDKDNGAAIDARGEVVQGGDAAGTFVGLAGLTERLARSQQVRACAAEQVLRHALGELVVAEVMCDVQGIATAPTFKDMLLAAAGSRALLQRTVSQ